MLTLDRELQNAIDHAKSTLENITNPNHAATLTADIEDAERALNTGNDRQKHAALAFIKESIY